MDAFSLVLLLIRLDCLSLAFGYLIVDRVLSQVDLRRFVRLRVDGVRLFGHLKRPLERVSRNHCLVVHTSELHRRKPLHRRQFLCPICVQVPVESDSNRVVAAVARVAQVFGLFSDVEATYSILLNYLAHHLLLLHQPLQVLVPLDQTFLFILVQHVLPAVRAVLLIFFFLVVKVLGAVNVRFLNVVRLEMDQARVLDECLFLATLGGQPLNDHLRGLLLIVIRLLHGQLI